jgi:sensor histidine kinase YesM
MYNALNAIQNYITSNEIKNAAKYLAKFAQLMRQSLEYSDLEIISLEKELEFLRDYLTINQKLRFENLDFEIVVDDEIEEDILGVPTMIVQPYVENAIEHGLRTRRKGRINIRFSSFNDYTLLCVIEDNGIGRDAARRLQEKDQDFVNHKSRGTSITEKRLEILHQSKGEEMFVNIIDLKDPETDEPTGTRVEIQIPIVEVQIK